MKFSVLHISDLHFGAEDPNGEQARMTYQIVRNLEQLSPEPDIVVVSGDLTYSGQACEFELAEAWLLKLISQMPTTPFYIVPGNHDVTRATADKGMLRAAAKSQDDYVSWRHEGDCSSDRSANFREWHKRASEEWNFGFDWDDSPLATSNVVTKDGDTIRIIGLNTASLSCDDDDQGNLVVDVRKMNEFLVDADSSAELIVAIGHHPIERWLTPWNAEQVGEIISQQTGPHAYLHGHLHEFEGEARSRMAGPRSVTLAAGAAYQGSNYPNGFSYYTFDCERNEIEPRISTYDRDTGTWITDTKNSNNLSCHLPDVVGFDAGFGSARDSSDDPSDTMLFEEQSKQQRREYVQGLKHDLRILDLFELLINAIDSLKLDSEKSEYLASLNQERRQLVRTVKSQSLGQNIVRDLRGRLDNSQPILILDDEDINIRQMCRNFEEQLFTNVTIASSLEQLERYFLESEVDLVLIDLCLPNVEDGWTALRRVMELTQDLPTRVLTYTNNLQNEKYRTQSMAYGAIDCLFLPMEGLFLSKIDRCLNAARTDRQFNELMAKLRELLQGSES